MMCIIFSIQLVTNLPKNAYDATLLFNIVIAKPKYNDYNAVILIHFYAHLHQNPILPLTLGA